MQLVKPINYLGIPTMHSQVNLLNHGDMILYFIYLTSYILYIISSGLNQINLVIHTTKLETFLLDPTFKN